MAKKGYPHKKQPRSMETIKQEIGQRCFKAGQLQYQIVTVQDELNKVNEELKELDAEALERIELDKAEASKSEVKEGE